MKVIDCEQRSEAWYQVRLGKLTGSRAGDLLAKVKSGESAGRRNLRLALTLERLTGKSQDNGYVSAAMEAGIERESFAVAAYEALTGCLVQPTGFLAHDSLLAGCSLDGHLGDFTELLSIKCRQPAAHLECIRTGKIPADALAQIRHELWIVSSAKAHHYFSWNPDFPEALQARLVTVRREDVDIPGYEREALAFLAEIDRECEAIRTMTDLRAQLKAAG